MKRKMVALLAFSALLMIKPITAYATEELSAETWNVNIEELHEEQQEEEQQAENENVLYGNAKPNPKFSEDGYAEQRQELPTLSGSTDGNKAPKTNDGQVYTNTIFLLAIMGIVVTMKILRSLRSESVK